MNSLPTLEVLAPGFGITVQDMGRPGWKRFGVPPGGAMDRHSLRIANRLVGNPESAPALELLMHGARIRVLRDVRIAIAGSHSATQLATWRSEILSKGGILDFPSCRFGLWTYVAISGGVAEPHVFGSASAYPRGGIGRLIEAGCIVNSGKCLNSADLSHDGGRVAAWPDQRTFDVVPPIRLWPGPQAGAFPDSAWEPLLAGDWTISSRSDRTGFRLDGNTIAAPPGEMRSEPVCTGSIQIPPGGQPIVTMRDGPTVGGYPKLAIVDDDSLDWLAQCAPGVVFRFARI